MRTETHFSDSFLKDASERHPRGKKDASAVIPKNAENYPSRVRLFARRTETDVVEAFNAD